MINSACHDNQAEHYDSKLLNDQDNELDYIRENYTEIHHSAIAQLNLKNGDRLLDIGIGTGLLEEKICVPVSICGIDISAKMLEKAQEKGLNIELKQGSFLAIPYPDGSFSHIVSCFAFHHLNNPEKIQALDEMLRVMGEAGILVLADFMYENAQADINLRAWFVQNNRIDMIEEMDDENFTNIEWLQEIAHIRQWELETTRASTLSWIVKLQKRNHPDAPI